MKPAKERKSDKAPYEKPRLRTIELVAEEVLGVGCKLPGGPGPLAGTCTTGPKCVTPGTS